MYLDMTKLRKTEAFYTLSSPRASFLFARYIYIFFDVDHF